LDLQKLFLLKYILKKKSYIPNPKNIFETWGDKLSIRVAKDQNIRRIARLWDFDNMRWRKKENWGWNPNLTKSERIN
jgi:hypothetical protein